METEKTNKPPVDIEQWLDFIIAAPAHRSQNEAHRKFGELIINRFFVSLRDELKGNPVDRGYLDNILCAAASAIRGFSVVRDELNTKWTALENDKQREKERAERIDKFAPFKQDGYWKQAIIVISTLGLASIILAGFQKSIGSLSWILVLAIAAAIAVGLVGMEYFVDWIRSNRLAEIEKRFPEERSRIWKETALQEYRKLSRQFLLSAIKIREEFYPNLTTLGKRRVFENYKVPNIECGVGGENAAGSLEELNKCLDAIIEQHFTFKPKEGDVVTIVDTEGPTNDVMKELKRARKSIWIGPTAFGGSVVLLGASEFIPEMSWAAYVVAAVGFLFMFWCIYNIRKVKI